MRRPIAGIATRGSRLTEGGRYSAAFCRLDGRRGLSLRRSPATLAQDLTLVVEAPGIEPGSEAASRETSTSVVPVLVSPE